MSKFTLAHKLVLGSIIVGILSFVSCGQKMETDIQYSTKVAVNDPSVFYYTPGKKLTLTDFQAPAEENSPAVAITNAGFAFKAGYRRTAVSTTLTITVFCSFNRGASWMKEKGKTPYILNHEQQHFNISYISAMLFMKDLKAASFTAQNYSEVLQKIYNKSVDYMNTLQDQYDSETQNGILKDKQEAWNEKISGMLEEAQ